MAAADRSGSACREQVRLRAAEMFARDADPREVARELRVSTKSVYQWRRAWKAGGEAALASKGQGGSPCKLDEAQIAQLLAALEAGPAAYGWNCDQWWTLARAARWPCGCSGSPTRCAGCRSCCTASAAARRSRRPSSAPGSAPSSAGQSSSTHSWAKPGSPSPTAIDLVFQPL
jgi:transposase